MSNCACVIDNPLSLSLSLIRKRTCQIVKSFTGENLFHSSCSKREDSSVKVVSKLQSAVLENSVYIVAVS